MDQLIVEFAKEWGGPVVGLIIAAVYFLDKMGIIKRWSTKRTTEREQLSEDQQSFVTNLQGHINNLNKWREEDYNECERRLKVITEDYERKLSDVNKRVDALFEDVDKWRKDSTKWRHLSGNLAMYVNRLRKNLIEAGVSPPRFNGWELFLAEGGSPEEFQGLDGTEDEKYQTFIDYDKKDG